MKVASYDRRLRKVEALRPDHAAEARKRWVAASSEAWSSFELRFMGSLVRLAEGRAGLQHTHLRTDLEPGWWLVHVDPEDRLLVERLLARHDHLVADLVSVDEARCEAAAARAVHLKRSDGFRGEFWKDEQREVDERYEAIRSRLIAQGVHLNETYKHFNYGELKEAAELDVARRYVVRSLEVDVGGTPTTAGSAS